MNALSYPEQTFQVAFHAMATERLEILLPWRGNQFATMIPRTILQHIGVITIMVMSCILGCWWVALVLLTAVVTAAGETGWEVGRHIVHVAVWELAALFVCMEQVRWRGLALLRKVRERAAQKVVMKEKVVPPTTPQQATASSATPSVENRATYLAFFLIIATVQ